MRPLLTSQPKAAKLLSKDDRQRDSKAYVLANINLHEQSASDIHMEPVKKMAKVRFRIDGVRPHIPFIAFKYL